MQELRDLYMPQWGVEPWLQDSWQVLTDAERQQVKQRLDDLFANGLPLHMTQDKKLYMHLFCLLTQLEVLGIQTPLKFESRMAKPEFRQRMRQQLTDEVFHTLAFTKIAYALAAPLAMPPTYNKYIERFCRLVSGEEDTQMAVLLTNLIAEGFIEEIFAILKKYNIAPRLFAVILEDEQRHISDVEVYRELGMPDCKKLQDKLAVLEEELVTHVFFQPTYLNVLISLIGVDACTDLIASIDKKYKKQLASIKLKPSNKWHFFIKFSHSMLAENQAKKSKSKPVEASTTRRLLMSQWEDPVNPTMSSVISLDVSTLHFFDKKYPAETLNCLVLQAISKFYADNSQFRMVMPHNKILQAEEIGIALAVNLPDCGDHLGMIDFHQCHQTKLVDIILELKAAIQIMTYCHKKSLALKQQYPHLMDIVDDLLLDRQNNVLAQINPERSFVTVSNIGYWGFELAVSPLMPGEVLKFTLTQIERKQVWNNQTMQFETQDRLPIGISVDHRVFDGNVHVAKLLQQNFNQVFENFVNGEGSGFKPKNSSAKVNQFIQFSEQLVQENLDYAFRFLLYCSHYWRCDNSMKQALSRVVKKSLLGAVL
jgi:hypothetical protein